MLPEVNTFKGDYIIRQGQQHQRIYQVASGSCDVVVDRPEGRKHLVRLEKDSLIGEMTFLDPDNQKVPFCGNHN
jgi:CRP-like cAMP-binding protein